MWANIQLCWSHKHFGNKIISESFSPLTRLRYTNFASNKCSIHFYKITMDVYEEGGRVYENTTW